MRARGGSGTELFTAESMAEKFGVQQGSYEGVPLPADIEVQQVVLALAPLRDKGSLPRTGSLLSWVDVPSQNVSTAIPAGGVLSKWAAI